MVWKIISAISCFVTIASLIFACQERSTKKEIEQLNRENVRSSYETWQKLYSSFEEFEDGEKAISKEHFIMKNKELFSSLNKRIIQNVLSQYKRKNANEYHELLKEWEAKGQIPSYAVDEFKEEINFKN